MAFGVKEGRGARKSRTQLGPQGLFAIMGLIHSGGVSTISLFRTSTSLLCLGENIVAGLERGTEACTSPPSLNTVLCEDNGEIQLAKSKRTRKWYRFLKAVVYSYGKHISL